MKKIVILLIALNSFAQSPNIQWQNYYGGTKIDNSRSVIQTPDGGYLSVGYTFSNDDQVSGLHGDGTIEDIWVVKLSQNGLIEWQKVLGGNGDEEAFSVINTIDGGYIIAGYATYPNSGDVSGIHSNDYKEDFWIIKLSNIGDIQWAKAIGGSKNEIAKDIKQTLDGGYIVIGSTQSNDFDASNLHGTFDDAWVVKLNQVGDIEWQRTYGGTDYDFGSSIIQTVDGGYIFTGSAKSNDGDLLGIQTSAVYHNMWVVKISSTGNIEWQKIISGGGLGTKIKKTSDGYYLVMGSAGPQGVFSNLSGPFYGHTGVAKLNTNGDIVWAITYGGSSGGTYLGNLIENSDGNYIFSTRILSNDGDVTTYFGYDDIWIVKINKNTGNIIWQKTLGFANVGETSSSIEQTNDGGYIISGNATSASSFPGYHGGGSDIYIIKLLPEQLSNFEFNKDDLVVFPNPTSKTLNLKYNNEIIIKKIVITDLTGKTIIESFEKNSTQIDVKNLSNGVYFVQAFSEEKKYQFKFIKQ